MMPDATTCIEYSFSTLSMKPRLVSSIFQYVIDESNRQYKAGIVSAPPVSSWMLPAFPPIVRCSCGLRAEGVLDDYGPREKEKAKYYTWRRWRLRF